MNGRCFFWLGVHLCTFFVILVLTQMLAWCVMRLSKAETSCLGNDNTHSQDRSDTGWCCEHLSNFVGRWAVLKPNDHWWHSWVTCVEKRLCLPFCSYVCCQAFISLVTRDCSSWRLDFSSFTFSLWRLLPTRKSWEKLDIVSFTDCQGSDTLACSVCKQESVSHSSWR